MVVVANRGEQCLENNLDSELASCKSTTLCGYNKNRAQQGLLDSTVLFTLHYMLQL